MKLFKYKHKSDDEWITIYGRNFKEILWRVTKKNWSYIKSVSEDYEFTETDILISCKNEVKRFRVRIVFEEI